MKPVQEQILSILQSAPASSFSLSYSTGYARPSIRREVQALRRAGHLINDARDNGGLYRLVVVAPVQG